MVFFDGLRGLFWLIALARSSIGELCGLFVHELGSYHLLIDSALDIRFNEMRLHDQKSTGKYRDGKPETLPGKETAYSRVYHQILCFPEAQVF